MSIAVTSRGPSANAELRVNNDDVDGGDVWAVETRSSGSSCRYHGDLDVDAAQSSGYLASIVTEEQSFGSSRCPWIVRAPRGQRLNISLLDFGLAHRRDSIASSPEGLGSGAAGPVDGLVSHGAGGVCHVYAKISERGAATSDITVRPLSLSFRLRFLCKVPGRYEMWGETKVI